MRIASTAADRISTEARLGGLRRELAIVSEELASGTEADIGRTLGPRVTDVSRLRDEIGRLETIRDTNALLGGRLATMQRALGDVADLAQAAFGDLTVTGGSAVREQFVASARARLSDLGARLDVTQDGMHLFSASRVDAPAFRCSGDPSSPPLAAVVDAFTAHFGFPPTAAAAQTVTADEMESFFAGPFDSLFADPAWADWSGAGGEPITARIAPGDHVEIGVDARDGAIRQLASGLAIAAVFAASGLAAEAESAARAEATQRIAGGQAGIDAMRAGVGRLEERVSAASASMTVSIGHLQTAESGLIGVDQTEVAVRLNEIAQRLEASLTVTRRLADLTLLNVL